MRTLELDQYGVCELSAFEELSTDGGNAKWWWEVAKTLGAEKVIEYAAQLGYDAWNDGIKAMSDQGAKSGIIAAL